MESPYIKFPVFHSYFYAFRELATQTHKFAKDMAKYTDLRIISIVGGDSMEEQFETLSTRPDVIIATPGRLMHQIREISTLKLKSVKYIVFDEADRLFEMGFAEVCFILKFMFRPSYVSYFSI